jgi:hypothetical protein
VNPSASEIEHEERVVGEEPARGPHLGGERSPLLRSRPSVPAGTSARMTPLDARVVRLGRVFGPYEVIEEDGWAAPLGDKAANSGLANSCAEALGKRKA